MRFVKQLWMLTILSFQKFAGDNGGLMAAAIAYWAMFSILPVLLLLLGLFGLVLQGTNLEGRVIDEVLRVLPFSEGQGRAEVTSAVESVSSATGGIFGVTGFVVAAWSLSNMFGAIRRSLNVVFNYEEVRSPVGQKLRDLAMVAGLAPFFLSSVAATALLRLAQRASEDVPYLGDLARALGITSILVFLLVPMLISFAAFGALYSFAAAKRMSFRMIWVGAAVAAVLFEISKFAFSWYLENLAAHQVVYGSLGIVLAFFFWTYVTSTILLFGGEVICKWPRLARLERSSARVHRHEQDALATKLLRLFRNFVPRP